MAQLDNLIADLHKQIPEHPNAAFTKPLRVDTMHLVIYYLEYLETLDAGVAAPTRAFAPESTKDAEGET